MRINCPYCQSKTIITHRVRISKTVSTIYVTCLNHECSARSVIRMSHTGTITPPASTQTDALHEWFANLPESEQKTIAKRYQPALF